MAIVSEVHVQRQVPADRAWPRWVGVLVAILWGLAVFFWWWAGQIPSHIKTRHDPSPFRSAQERRRDMGHTYAAALCAVAAIFFATTAVFSNPSWLWVALTVGFLVLYVQVTVTWMHGKD